MKAFRQLRRMVNREDPDYPVWFFFVLVDVTRVLPWGLCWGGLLMINAVWGFQLCHQLRADLGPVA